MSASSTRSSSGSFPLLGGRRSRASSPTSASIRPACAERGPAPPLRDPRRRDHRLRVRIDLQPVARGDDRRDARHVDPAGGPDAAKELAKQFTKRGITSKCTRVEQQERVGDGESVQCDLMLVSERLGAARSLAVDWVSSQLADKRAGIHDGCACRTSTRSATAPATGSSPTPRSARVRSPRRTRAATRSPSTATARCRARSRPIRVSRGRRRRHAGRNGGLGEVDPRDAIRRAARHGDGRAARDGHDRLAERRVRGHAVADRLDRRLGVDRDDSGFDHVRHGAARPSPCRAARRIASRGSTSPSPPFRPA